MLDKKLLAGGAVLSLAGFWFGVKPQFLDSAPPRLYTEEEIASAPRPTLTIKEMVVNLHPSESAPLAYAKVDIAIEFADPNRLYLGASSDAVSSKNESLAHELEPDMHKIRDAVISTIGSKSLEEVSTPGGREALKAELLSAINGLVTDRRAENVFFVTFITQ
jgi:flagellar protein FliL